MPRLVDDRPFAALMLVAALAAAGCAATEQAEQHAAEEPEAPAARLVVYAVNYPLQYFAQRVGGDHVDARLPVAAGVDPAYWSPGPEQIVEFQAADLILLNGAGYAKWVPTVSLPTSRVVDTSTGFTEPLITLQSAVTHSHGPEGEHSHGEAAFTTWLDPELAVAHAAAIRDALVAADPERSAAFEAGFAALEADLRELDARLREATGTAAERPLVGSHPVYQYLERRYGLDLASVHFEPGEDPGAAWADLDALLRDHPATLMLWEAEPLPATREALAERGIDVVVVATCANAPTTGDYLSVMRANADALAAALGAGGV